MSHLDPGGPGVPGVLRPLGRVVGGLLSLTLLVASGYYWLTFRNIERSVARIELNVGPTPSVSGSSAAPVTRAKAVNILIVGNDDRSNMKRKEQLDLHVGRGDGSNSTDTMMLVHIPADGSRATLISLPRDTEVDIPGFAPDLLNAAYIDGFNSTTGSHTAKVKAGANKLIEVVKDLTGQPIDHYVQVGLLGFYRIANALDGIPVNLCHDVDDSSYSGFVATKGPHTLDGKQALEFVRQRHGLGSDLDRVKRQQYFLTAAFRQAASAGILTELHSLGDALTSSIYTDQNFKILDLAKQIEKLTANNIRGVTIPTMFDGAHLKIDKAKVLAFVRETLYPPAAPSTSTVPGTSGPTRVTSTPAPDSSCVN